MENLKQQMLETLQAMVGKTAEIRNSRLIDDMGGIILRLFNDTETRNRVEMIKKAFKGNPQPPTGEYKVWTGGPYDPKLHPKPAVVVDEPKLPDGHDYSKLLEMDADQLVDYFGSVPKTRDFAKEIGIKVSPNDNKMKVVAAVHVKLKEMVGSGIEEDANTN